MQKIGAIDFTMLEIIFNHEIYKTPFPRLDVMLNRKYSLTHSSAYSIVDLICTESDMSDHRS